MLNLARHSLTKHRFFFFCMALFGRGESDDEVEAEVAEAGEVEDEDGGAFVVAAAAANRGGAAVGGAANRDATVGPTVGLTVGLAVATGD